jgi:hypothetical protein
VNLVPSLPVGREGIFLCGKLEGWRGGGEEKEEETFRVGAACFADASQARVAEWGGYTTSKECGTLQTIRVAYLISSLIEREYSVRNDSESSVILLPSIGQQAANDTCTVLFKRCFTEFANIECFRKTAKAGLPSGIGIRFAEIKAIVESPFLQPFLEPDAYTQNVQKQNILDGAEDGFASSFNSMMDAASLVFAHGALESYIHGLCYLSIQMKPNEWPEVFEKGSIAPSRLMAGETTESLLWERVEPFFKEFKRLALCVKLDRLFSKSDFENSLMPIPCFTWDMARMKALDRKRHILVHETPNGFALENGGADIQFMADTHLFILGVFKKSHDIELNYQAFASVAKPVEADLLKSSPFTT